MKEIRIGIERLADSELQRATQEYHLFASDHEAESVIREEIEESAEDIEQIEEQYYELWNAVRADDEEAAYEAANRIKHYAVYAAAELVQVAAMADKLVVSQKAR